MPRNNALRTWWKPWTWSMRTWAIAILLAVWSLPLVNRWSCLWLVPDVVLPFNVDDVIQDEVPEDQTAMGAYANVLKLLASGDTNAQASGTERPASRAELTIKEITERLLHHNEQALAEYIRAGQLEKSGGPSLKTMTFATNLDQYQQLRQLVHAYTALGLTLQDDGDVEKAWTCHLANLQCSIHCEQLRIAICGLIGASLRAIAAEGIEKWASNPSLSAERLKAARIDLQREYARRITILNAWKAEYIAVRNSLSRLDSVDYLLPNDQNAVPGSSSKPWMIAKRAFLWCMGQPEMVLRTNRQLLLNCATEVDKPLYLRRRTVTVTVGGNDERVFELDPKAPKVSGQLGADQLAGILLGKGLVFRINNAIIPAMAGFDKARRRDQARFRALIILFAAHEYQRTVDEFPQTIEQLVPQYLEEVPFDPMDNQGAPMKYRREDDGTALVWSVSINGIDDKGSIHAPGYLDCGHQIKVIPIESDLAGATKSKTEPSR